MSTRMNAFWKLTWQIGLATCSAFDLISTTEISPFALIVVVLCPSRWLK